MIENSPSSKIQTSSFLSSYPRRLGEGGLRTKGFYKSSTPSEPLVSVITIVLNGEEYIEKTIQSVIRQTYKNIEYIVVDGGSTDATLDIIHQYENTIDYWVSENDKGIYDAMNRGIDLSTGWLINFINAGDLFYNNSTIATVSREIGSAGVIYGKTLIDYGTGYKNMVEPNK